MRILFTIGLVIIVTNLLAFSGNVQDSIKLDKKKIEKVIETIKKKEYFKNPKFWDSIKDFDQNMVTFSYPDKITGGQEYFSIDVLYDGEVVLMHGIKLDTYEFGEIADLR